MAEEHFIVCVYHIFIHSSVGHLVCLHVLSVVNSAAMNIGVHVAFWIIVAASFKRVCMAILQKMGSHSAEFMWKS